MRYAGPLLVAGRSTIKRYAAEAMIVVYECFVKP